MGIGLLAAKQRANLPSSRLSHQPTTGAGAHDSSTPTSNLRKAADLVAQMNAREGTGVIAGPQYVSGLRLPRIQSSRQSGLGTPAYSQGLSRAHSRQNLPGPSLARIYSSKLSSAGKRNHQYISNQCSPNVHLEPDTLNLSPSSQRRYELQRPRSIQREYVSSVHPPSSGLGTRADQSALEHIRRIRRNLPSGQNQRLSYDEKSYLSNINNKMPERVDKGSVDDYKRIKQEEAAARAMLM